MNCLLSLQIFNEPIIDLMIRFCHLITSDTMPTANTITYQSYISFSVTPFVKLPTKIVHVWLIRIYIFMNEFEHHIYIYMCVCVCVNGVT